MQRRRHRGGAAEGLEHPHAVQLRFPTAAARPIVDAKSSASIKAADKKTRLSRVLLAARLSSWTCVHIVRVVQTRWRKKSSSPPYHTKPKIFFSGGQEGNLLCIIACLLSRPPTMTPPTH